MAVGVNMWRCMVVAVAFAIGNFAAGPGSTAFAQIGFQQQAVGGVSVNAKGVLVKADVDSRKELDALKKQTRDDIPGDLNAFAPLRRVSLRGLEAAIAAHRAEHGNAPLPEAIQFLAGLQQIKYVLVYPEDHDIVLVGPAEGWRMDDMGNFVGITTGRPVMFLDDLMVAFRTGPAVYERGFSCSIDPTPEGLTRLRSLAKGLKEIGNPEQTMNRITDALGPQVISVNGLPETSHFARVMVAADFRMKRLAMNFDESPVAGMPSFLQLSKADKRGMNNMLPRWWLAPKADPMLAGADGLAWEIRGLSVQCLTEEDFVKQDGTREHSGEAGAVAKKWADTFTAKYDELVKKDAIFGQLRNLMDLAVVAALVQRENLLDKANLQVPHLVRQEAVAVLNAPKSVDSQASVLKKGKNWMISASGGIQIFPAGLTDKSESTEKLSAVRSDMNSKHSTWWWN